jgi:predicted dehydrogenase
MNIIACNNIRWGRRRFLAGAAVAAVPMLLPRWARGQAAATAQMEIAAIGVGRMGHSNLKLILQEGLKHGARVVAVCDYDSKRAESAKKMVDDFYAEKTPDQKGNCATYGDYREAIARPDLDGVLISTPDHQHIGPALLAAKAGKHIYLEKPLTYTHAEGQQLVKAVRDHKVVLQTGSMQRSSKRFREACELALNGRLGKVHTIIAQLPPDRGTGRTEKMPVPPNLNFDGWLGPRPLAEYTEDRVHPQNGFGRPGWLQIEDYCLGMVTGWGAHMFDIAQWANGSDDSGLVELSAKGEFPDRGLFNVHTNFTMEGTFANGVRLLGKTGDAGVWIEGEKGKIWVSRELMKTEPREIAREKIGEGEKRLPVSQSHMGDFLASIREGRDPICPVEVGHRSNTICIQTHIAMKLGRKLKWDPVAETFPGDAEANAMLDYKHRV